MEQIVLRRIIGGDSRLFFLVNKQLFINPLAQQVLDKIQNYYNKFLVFPNQAEIQQLCDNSSLAPYIENICKQAPQNDVNAEFLSYELKNIRARDSFIDSMKELITEIPELGYDEISERLYNSSIKIREYSDSSQTIFESADIPVCNTSEIIRRLPSGLEKFDHINGGFAPGELILIGGMRGTGKSIVLINLLINYFLKYDCSVVLFSIEMAKNEVNNRLKSIMSGVPNALISKNELTEEHQQLILASKIRSFFDTNDPMVRTLLQDCLKGIRSIEEIEQQLKTAPKLDKRFFIIDDPNLSLARADYYMNLLKRKSKAPIIATGIDYLNILNTTESGGSTDWQVQNEFAKGAKRFARTHNTITFAPNQIDGTGKARFAVAVEDHIDCAMKFVSTREQRDAGILPIYLDKMRNGRDDFCFEMLIDKDTLKLNNLSDVAEVENEEV